MLRIIVTLVMLLGLTAQVNAAACGNRASGFKPWLSKFKKEMRAKGFSRRTLSASLNGLTYDRRVIRLDRGQKSFKQSFKKFYRRRTHGMVRIGRGKMRKHARVFARVEKIYGVPASLLTAIWGLETAFGNYMGKRSIMRSLATMAYDCRRTTFFTHELVSALIIVQRGHLRPSEMRGAWAGEIGQTQFLASRFVNYARSFDGNKTIDLYHSIPDVLASTAAWFKGNGWQRGAGWEPGTANYEVIAKWNRARVYQKTISMLTSELERARRARPVAKKRIRKRRRVRRAKRIKHTRRTRRVRRARRNWGAR